MHSYSIKLDQRLRNLSKQTPTTTMIRPRATDMIHRADFQQTP